MRGKPAAGPLQQRARATTDDDKATLLEGRIREALERSYLKGRKLIGVKIRQVEGNSVQGFLKINGSKGDRHLVDFRATSSPQGGLSSLEVDGRRIAIAGIPATRR